MNLPKPPQTGQPVSPDWGRSVCDALRRQQLTAGPGITLNRTPGGTTISSKGSGPGAGAVQAAEGGVVVAKIESGTAIDGYTITCYPNYPSLTPSTGGTLAVMEMALGGDLPVGTLVIAHTMAVTVTGGE